MKQVTFMWQQAASLVWNDEAQDLAEYGIALAVIVIGVVLISVAIGGDVETLWSNAQSIVLSVVDSEP